MAFHGSTLYLYYRLTIRQSMCRKQLSMCEVEHFVSIDWKSVVSVIINCCFRLDCGDNRLSFRSHSFLHVNESIDWWMDWMSLLDFDFVLLLADLEQLFFVGTGMCSLLYVRISSKVTWDKTLNQFCSFIYMSSASGYPFFSSMIVSDFFLRVPYFILSRYITESIMKPRCQESDWKTNKTSTDYNTCFITFFSNYDSFLGMMPKSHKIKHPNL